MSGNSDGFWAGLIVGVLIMSAILSFLNSGWRREAVDRGKAEYYLDQNQNRQWRWLP